MSIVTVSVLNLWNLSDKYKVSTTLACNDTNLFRSTDLCRKYVKNYVVNAFSATREVRNSWKRRIILVDREGDGQTQLGEKTGLLQIFMAVRENKKRPAMNQRWPVRV